MPISRLAYALAILSVLASCSDANEPTAGAGGGAAGQDGGQSGAGGQHDASTDMLSCSERESIASNSVADALVGADLGCSADSECEEISIDTECHAACGAVVATQHKAEVQAAIAEQALTTCANYENDGCMRVIPPCEPLIGTIVCQAGRCTFGEPEACTGHVIRWGSQGGLADSRTLFVLEPCARFRAFTMTPDQTDATMICDNVVPGDHPITGATIDALIAGDDVQNALADAPVVLGVDDRAVDRPLIRVEIDGAILDVGEPCEGAEECTEIPPGVRALVTMLQSLIGQQHDVAPTCMNTT